MLAHISFLPATVADAVIESENSLKIQSGRQKIFGNKTMGPHQHGAGIAWSEKGAVNISKVSADNMWRAEFCGKIREIRSNITIAHVREASTGLRIDETCAHPFAARFEGQDLAFCHNGSVNSYFDEAKQRGITDTQIYLENLLRNLKTLDLSSLTETLRKISSDWRYSSASALLMSANRLFAWRMLNPLAPAVNHAEEIYTLYYKKTQNCFTIASENLDNSEGWVKVKNKQIFSLEIGANSIICESAEI